MKKFQALVVLSSLALSAPGCLSKTVVGDEKSPDLDTPQEPLPPYEASGPCAEQDEIARGSYEAWRRAPNAFNGLRGMWTGNVAGIGDVELSLGAERGTIRFGDGPVLEAPTDPDAPYACAAHSATTLCKPESGQLMGGVDYPIHRAQADEDLLTFPVAINQPWEAWCSLQTPVFDEFNAASGTECRYWPAANLPSSYVAPCKLGNDPIDCQLLELRQMSTCQCASDGCVMFVTTSIFEFRILQDGNQLIGTRDGMGRIELFKE